LENITRKALLLAQNYTVTVEHVRAALDKTAPPEFSPKRAFGEYVDELLAAAQRGELADAHARALGAAERELFARAITAAGGNQAKAARWLGITRVTMKAKLVQFGLHAGHESEPG
jgi:DNA-binding NtrC family response regulator